jgi:hypothetical protein
MSIPILTLTRKRWKKSVESGTRPTRRRPVAAFSYFFRQRIENRPDLRRFRRQILHSIEKLHERFGTLYNPLTSTLIRP